MPRVFLITGTSTGFGKYYAQEVLDRGDYVVATARKPESLSFKNTSEKNYLSAQLDVTDKSSIQAAFDAALKKFGRVDVVCNNAGYGLSGCFEEYKDDEIRQQMEINFFGLLDVTRIALETMREKQSPSGGLIQQGKFNHLVNRYHTKTFSLSDKHWWPTWRTYLQCILRIKGMYQVSG